MQITTLTTSVVIYFSFLYTKGTMQVARGHISKLLLLGGAVLVFILASVIINSRPAHAQTQVYKRVNNQTVKVFFTSDVPNERGVSDSVVYYVADRPVDNDGYGDNGATPVMDNEIFKNITFPPQLECSEDYLFIKYETVLRKYYLGSQMGACYDEPVVGDITSYIPDGQWILFFKDTTGIIRPVMPSATPAEFKKVIDTTSLGLNAGENVYIQTTPASTCPNLLVSYSSGNWGFIAPHHEDGFQSNDGSRYYRQILTNYKYDMSNVGGCNADDNHGTRQNNEKTLTTLLGADDGHWQSSYNNISFHDMNEVVKNLNAAVGDADAAEILLGTSPGGSVSPEYQDNRDGSDDTPAPPACAIENVGWIVCPVMSFLGWVTDGAYNILADNFLETNANLVSTTITTDGKTTENAVYTAWKAMRNIANIAFVIAFIVIIYSQLTGYGVTNYGVKKMLPRLIVAAVLINISFFICQIAVDLSNILGYSLKDVISNIPGLTNPDGISDQSGNGFGIATIVVTILAGGYAAVMAVSVPVILAIILALLMIVLILVGRTALIVLLVILSPLAFVAYLFPNTEQYFKKWYKLFYSLLLLFPIIGVVFGASTLASTVIASVANLSNNPEVTGLIAAAVKAVPLFVVPTLLKGALNGTGTIGAKLSNWSSKANSGVQSGVKQSRLGDLQRNMQQNAALRRAKARGGVATGDGRNPLNWASHAGAFGNRVTSGMLPGSLVGKYGAKASALEEKEYEEGVSAAQDKQKGMLFTDIKAIANGSAKATKEERTAAIRHIMDNGSFDDRRELIASSGSMTEDAHHRRAVANGFLAKGDHKLFGPTLSDQILSGNVTAATLDSALTQNIADGKIDAATVARDVKTTDYIKSTATAGAQNGTLTVAHGMALTAIAQQALATPEIAKGLTTEHKSKLNSL